MSNQNKEIEEASRKYRIGLYEDVIDKQGVKDAIGMLFGYTTPIAQTQNEHIKREEHAEYLAKALENLITQSNQALIDEIIEKLPEERKTTHKLEVEEPVQSEIDVGGYKLEIDGTFNQALSKVKQLLLDIRSEL